MREIVVSVFEQYVCRQGETARHVKAVDSAAIGGLAVRYVDSDGEIQSVAMRPRELTGGVFIARVPLDARDCVIVMAGAT